MKSKDSLPKCPEEYINKFNRYLRQYYGTNGIAYPLRRIREA